MSDTVYVLNGPNLNLLGTREPEKYGHATLADVEKLVRDKAASFGWTVEFRQSNHEGELVDWIQEAAAKKAVGVVLNPAAYTTTSIALLDAILATKLPVVEIHITNIHARESFRHDSYVSKAARAVICGFGVEGYALALAGLAAMTGAKAAATKTGARTK
jgi:3-dehydroquinate dehydratase-2